MEFNKLILTRQSCRDYDKDKKVPLDVIKQIAEDACKSPSACNSQPWKLVIADGEVAAKIPPILQEMGFNKYTDNVGTFIVLCETFAVLRKDVTYESQHFAQMDVGSAAAYLTLSAANRGVASCIIGAFNEDSLKKLLNIPGDVKIRLVIALGYPATDSIRDKIRKDTSETISVNKW